VVQKTFRWKMTNVRLRRCQGKGRNSEPNLGAQALLMLIFPQRLTRNYFDYCYILTLRQTSFSNPILCSAPAFTLCTEAENDKQRQEKKRFFQFAVSLEDCCGCCVWQESELRVNLHHLPPSEPPPPQSRAENERRDRS
jgi:hypothetical protein